MIPSIFPPTLRVCPRKLCLEILLVHLWQRPDVKDCLQGNLLSQLSANIRKHTTNKCFVRIKLKLNFFTSSLVILLSVSLVGVPQSLRTLVIWSISEICHMRFSNVMQIVIIQSLIRDGDMRRCLFLRSSPGKRARPVMSSAIMQPTDQMSTGTKRGYYGECDFQHLVTSNKST